MGCFDEWVLSASPQSQPLVPVPYRSKRAARAPSAASKEAAPPQEQIDLVAGGIRHFMEAMATDWRLVEDADKDLDFGTVFDDEDFLDLFLSAPRSGVQTIPRPAAGGTDEQVPAANGDQPIASNGASSKPTAENVERFMTASYSQSPNLGVCGQSSVVPFSSSTGLMNIIMLVDPVTDQVTLPRQDVIAGEGNKVVTIGPTVLANFSKLDFSSLSSEVLLARTEDQDPPMKMKAAHHLGQLEVEPPRAENKFLPISSFSLQSDASSWNPHHLLAGPAAASQPYALGSFMFPQTNHSQGLQMNAFDPSHSLTSLAPDHPPASMATDMAVDSASYNCVSESSSLDGGSVQSSGTMAQGVPVPSPVTAPLRALSAYNFFFRDERDRILHGGEIEWTKEKQEKLLHDHWNQDRTKKRRHRKSHGKIDFSTLSKVISTRWKELPEDRKDYFREVAARDWERFQRELAEYKHGASVDGTGALAANAATANSFASFSFSTVIG